MPANAFTPVIINNPTSSLPALIHLSTYRIKQNPKRQKPIESKIIRNFLITFLSPCYTTSVPSSKAPKDKFGESTESTSYTPTQSKKKQCHSKTPTAVNPVLPSVPKSHSSNYYSPQYLINPIVIDKIIHRITLTTIKSFKMSTPGDYSAVAEAICKIIPQEDYDDGSIGPVLVRLAWHASGTYDAATGTGGSNGATMRYDLEAKDSANNGLEHARRFLEPIKQQFPWITYSDLWTFAGVVAVEYMEGPKVPWRPGRVDYIDETNVPPNGRLPDGALGQDHLRSIFYRMGFNDQEIVALCGAHNLGRTHADRSGFDGPWVPNPTQFSNTYYKLLLHEEWTLSKSPAGLPQYYDPDKELMMLPADFSLIQDPEFKKWVEIYAEDKKLFYDHFAKAFAKLLELGVRRGPNGLAKVNEIGKINVDPAKI